MESHNLQHSTNLLRCTAVHNGRSGALVFCDTKIEIIAGFHGYHLHCILFVVLYVLFFLSVTVGLYQLSFSPSLCVSLFLLLFSTGFCERTLIYSFNAKNGSISAEGHAWDIRPSCHTPG